MKLDSSVVVITGGASGLGAATARLLAAVGATVVLADVQDGPGSALASELRGSARFVHTDVTSEESVEAVVRGVVEEFGRLDVLVSCAGIGGARKILGREGPHDLATFQRVLNINLVGTFIALRAAASAMSRNEPGPDGERGVVVCTASAAAFEGQIGQVAYAASKAGIVGLVLPAARELARQGIRVMAIAPGLFETPMLVGKRDAEIVSGMAAQVPFPARLGRPSEYAALAKHIIENTMLNGTVIRLDGALRMAAR